MRWSSRHSGILRPSYSRGELLDLHELMGAEENLGILPPVPVAVSFLVKVGYCCFPFPAVGKALEEERVGQFDAGHVVRGFFLEALGKTFRPCQHEGAVQDEEVLLGHGAFDPCSACRTGGGKVKDAEEFL